MAMGSKQVYVICLVFGYEVRLAGTVWYWPMCLPYCIGVTMGDVIAIVRCGFMITVLLLRKRIQGFSPYVQIKSQSELSLFKFLLLLYPFPFPCLLNLLSSCSKCAYQFDQIHSGSVDHSMTYLLCIFPPSLLSRQTSCFIVVNLRQSLPSNQKYLPCAPIAPTLCQVHHEHLHSRCTREEQRIRIYPNILVKHDNVPCCVH